MSKITIAPVRSLVEQKAFLQFPAKHYRGDDNWIPMLRSLHKELTGFSPHPFYENAEIERFLCYQDGIQVGQIAAIIDHGHNEKYSEHRGMFGFFESINDDSVAKALFDAAEEWLRGKDMDCVRGPNNPSLNHQYCGCQIDGFNKPPTFMMPYNKPYYENLITGQGYEKAQDFYSFAGSMSMIDDLDPMLQEFVDRTYRENADSMVVRRSKSGKHIGEDVKVFTSLYNTVLEGKWGFVPMTSKEVEHVADGLSQMIVPDLLTVIEMNGKPAAITFGILDYNPIIKKIGGKLFPFGFLRLLLGRRRLKRVRIIGTYVAHEYQRWGLALVLLERLIADLQAWGIEEVEFSYVLESNRQSRKTLEKGGAILDRTFRMYDKSLG